MSFPPAGEVSLVRLSYIWIGWVIMVCSYCATRYSMLRCTEPI
jgi:hypothetical protein